MNTFSSTITAHMAQKGEEEGITNKKWLQIQESLAGGTPQHNSGGKYGPYRDGFFQFATNEIFGVAFFDAQGNVNDAPKRWISDFETDSYHFKGPVEEMYHNIKKWQTNNPRGFAELYYRGFGEPYFLYNWNGPIVDFNKFIWTSPPEPIKVRFMNDFPPMPTIINEESVELMGQIGLVAMGGYAASSIAPWLYAYSGPFIVSPAGQTAIGWLNGISKKPENIYQAAGAIAPQISDIIPTPVEIYEILSDYDEK